MPATATITGSRRRRALASWPSTSSRLISSPTSRKNSAIAASLIHRCTVIGPIAGARTGPVGQWSSASYASAVAGRFAASIARRAAASSTAPPPASPARKARSADQGRRRIIPPPYGRIYSHQSEIGQAASANASAISRRDSSTP